ncbi:MAG TPA: hypothetical protein VK002_03310 [Rubricoccaceae bacterium]|jgi:hypothetical protein|nr:hypothetical protein [Rubricoccaceae bacterium]
MDPGLHVKQALNHLEKILGYYPYVEEGGEATVALTPEDWHVVADALFYMDTPREVIPEAITDYRLAEDGAAILLTVADGTRVTVEMG